MGLPIRLVAATNVNDSFHRGVSTGDFSAGEVVQTISPAMDIQFPYNMERIIFLFSGSDQVVTLMKELESNNRMLIPVEIREKISCVLSSQSVGHQDVIDILKRSWFDWHYLIDPHTAVAMFAATELQKRTNYTSPVVVLSTAHADKFPEAMSMTDIDHEPCEQVKALLQKPTKFQEFKKDDNWDKILLDIICSITERNGSAK